MRALFVAAALATAVSAAGNARGASVIQFDLDGLTIDAGGAFSESFTGTINISAPSAASLVGVFIGGQNLNQSGAFTGAMSSFTGSVEMIGGQIIGGGFSLALTDGDTYSAQIVSGTGQVRRLRSGYFFEGLTFGGMFTAPVFGGVDVTQWFNAQPLAGNFIEFGFTPDANGFDSTANMDIFVVIPLPAGAGMAVAGLLAAGCARRRRV